MDDRVSLKTYEGVRFMCENLYDIVVPFTILFEEPKDIICKRIDPQILKIYLEDSYNSRQNMSLMKQRCKKCFQYITKVDHNTSSLSYTLSYNSESEDEFEGSYEIDDPNVGGNDVDCINEPDVEEVANVLASQHSFGDPSFMRALDHAALNAPEFPQYAHAGISPIFTNYEFVIGIEFSSGEIVIATIKDYTIRRGVDYRVYESEPTTFYAKYVILGQSMNLICDTNDYVTADQMAKNLVECINGVLKGTHNFSVTALVRATFYRLNELFTRKRAKTEARINVGHIFSEAVMIRLKQISEH
ncbi:hypothetical protein Ahy_A07g033481 [Arachis hypogaea]|uniref:Uncharacterized protein n=1 Tax=Arachis hypogaea TaxID=3818 RepID=A0A445C9E5_ARAHY|nr:hypothetical protein Ahy_A07g033481 [Arachis hypogaea]